jgi:hypothetical protein
MTSKKKGSESVTKKQVGQSTELAAKDGTIKEWKEPSKKKPTKSKRG